MTCPRKEITSASIDLGQSYLGCCFPETSSIFLSSNNSGYDNQGKNSCDGDFIPVQVVTIAVEPPSICVYIRTLIDYTVD